jgi:hypothetical protein
VSYGILSVMTESTPATNDPNATPAQKREWLRANGHQVGLRGKLSKQHEDDFANGRRAEKRAEV